MADRFLTTSATWEAYLHYLWVQNSNLSLALFPVKWAEAEVWGPELTSHVESSTFQTNTHHDPHTMQGPWGVSLTSANIRNPSYQGTQKDATVSVNSFGYMAILNSWLFLSPFILAHLMDKQKSSL